MAIAKHCDGEATDSPAGRLKVVQARVATACARAKRSPGAVTLVAVSKTYGTRDVEALIAAGQLCFGENRVQEAQEKFSPLRSSYPGLRLHLVGSLQTNKAADAVEIADTIESLDRPRLADAISRAADRAGRVPTLLVQVNTGDEAQKSGVSRHEADRFIIQCQTRFGKALAGLMCVPPATEDPAVHFEWLATCAARHGLATLSMGMSGDFEIAIAHGATHVRVGSAIFGARPPASIQARDP